MYLQYENIVLDFDKCFCCHYFYLLKEVRSITIMYFVCYFVVFIFTIAHYYSGYDKWQVELMPFFVFLNHQNFTCWV